MNRTDALIALLDVAPDTAMVDVGCGSGRGDQRRAGEIWLAEQRERGRRGRLFLALPLFVAAATLR
ncbi:hypothetical protein ACIBCT_02730 [Streptosporangium sp. NPDC050855]|uniref:hypothetical protein n=1 Tax=Streptosporangium sp. NPDC050855 TaxID=3366194 RepID=UPI0037AFA699